MYTINIFPKESRNLAKPINSAVFFGYAECLDKGRVLSLSGFNAKEEAEAAGAQLAAGAVVELPSGIRLAMHTDYISKVTVGSNADSSGVVITNE